MLGFTFGSAEMISAWAVEGESRVASFDWTAGQMSPPVFRPKVPFEKEVILV